MSLNPNRTTTDFEFNHEGQPDAYGPSVGDFTIVQQKFDSRAVDNLTDINQLKDTLRSISVGDSGAHNVGHKSLSLTAENVAEALEENRLIINSLSTADGQNVKITGNQTIAGIKTFSSSPIVPTPSSSTQAANKSYVDGKDSAQTAALTAHKASADHDGRYYTETEVDAFAVKLTGNQSIAGIKTFTSSPVIPAPTTDLQAATKKYVDDKAPLTILDNSVTDAKLVDVGGVKSAVYDSQAINLVEANGYTKLADDGQDVTLWTAGTGELTASTVNVKLGKQAIRIKELDNIAGTLGASKNNITLDYSKLENGETSTDDDYVVVPVFCSDVNFVQRVQIFFSTLAVFTGSDVKFITIPQASLISGWNYLELKKSDFDTAGAGSWNGIQSINHRWTSLANAQNVYCEFQYNQLVKADPSLTYPNSLQNANGKILNHENLKLFVGYEFGKLVVKPLKNVTGEINSMYGNVLHGDIIVSMMTTVATNNTVNLCGLRSTSAIGLILYLTSGNLQLRKFTPTSTTLIKPFAVSIGDKVFAQIKRYGNQVKAIVINITTGATAEIPMDISDLPAQMYESYHNYISTTGQIIEAMGATQLEYADTCNLAEQAKSLTKQAFIKLERTGVKIIAHATTTVIDWDSVEALGFSVDALGEEITFHETGKFLVTIQTGLEINTTGTRDLSVLYNGVSTILEDYLNAVAVQPTVNSISAIRRFKSGDKLKIRIRQSSGISLNLLASTNKYPYVEIIKVG